MQKVRFGVLGVAKIATERVIPAMRHCQFAEVTAIASRTLDKAQRAATNLGLPKAHGSYEALLADPDIDAIYNPLPNHLHVPWSIQALEAGKHVLCEKPIALQSDEAQTLIDAGQAHPRLKLMEAFMYRHHPQWVAAKKIVADGGVGRLRTIATLFSYFNRDAANVRNQAEIGGGALMDIGCYGISLARFIFGEEPHRVLGLLELDPEFGTDRLTSGVLLFGDGTSTFTCSTQLTPFQRVQIMGTEGRLEIEIPFNAPHDKPCKMWHATARENRLIELPLCDQYAIQGDLFAQAIQNDTPVPTPIPDALANMQVIDALRKSSAEGAWIVPAGRQGSR